MAHDVSSQRTVLIAASKASLRLALCSLPTTPLSFLGICTAASASLSQGLPTGFPTLPNCLASQAFLWDLSECLLAPEVLYYACSKEQDHVDKTKVCTRLGQTRLNHNFKVYKSLRSRNTWLPTLSYQPYILEPVIGEVWPIPKIP